MEYSEFVPDVIRHEELRESIATFASLMKMTQKQTAIFKLLLTNVYLEGKIVSGKEYGEMFNKAFPPSYLEQKVNDTK